MQATHDAGATDLPPSLGPRAARRPTAWTSRAVAAGGGALVGAGMVSIGAEVTPDDADLGIVGALLCAALVVGALWSHDRIPAPARPASATAAIIGVAGAIGFVVLVGAEGFDDARPFFLVCIAGWSTIYLFGPLRGRTELVGLSLFLAWFWIVAELLDGDSPTGPIDQAPFLLEGGELDPFATVPIAGSDLDSGGAGFASLLIGIAYLAGVIVFDRRRWHGLATAGIAPGVIALVYGIVQVAESQDNVVLGGLLSITGGVYCGVVGVRIQRRFITWTGGLLATVGVFVVSADISESVTGDGSDDFGLVLGLVLVGVGVGTVLLSGPLAGWFGDPSGDDGPRPMARSGASPAPPAAGPLRPPPHPPTEPPPPAPPGS